MSHYLLRLSMAKIGSVLFSSPSSCPHEYSVITGNLSNLPILQVCNLGIAFYSELPLGLCV